jgi:adenosylcobinamide-GDP ribazoletransferase
MKEEIKIFFTALMFYTRIPCPSWVDHSPEYINKATFYFPFIGWIVGIISFGFYFIASVLFSHNISICISMLAGMLTTGAFHEDGFADSFDGFGGGWTKEKILDIMKDSRVGVYGVIALIMLLILKFISTNELFAMANYWEVGLIFIGYHALARLTALQMVFTSEYVREDEQSKAKPIAKSTQTKQILGAFFFGLLPFSVLICIHPIFVTALFPLTLLAVYARNYLHKWIGGYTGDCLGAIEQLAELIILLSLTALWKYI